MPWNLVSLIYAQEFRLGVDQKILGPIVSIPLKCLLTLSMPSTQASLRIDTSLTQPPNSPLSMKAALTRICWPHNVAGYVMADVRLVSTPTYL